ncbi:permease family-domain-containing protein [Rhodotorula diobovata]|uniref:Permease family-domain-containing protein n=1 Tax=Rhodotorula diobovata TaxID=5288 RepID=A0A5C5G6K3_9BASI|nr:permease family-domain-containing protein [Rhodotorula diobovata]
MLTSRDFWIGDYDYKALLSVKNKHIPFFGPNQRIPVVLALILGIQHALAMLGGLVVPPILLSGPAGAGLSADDQIYLVAASLVWCGLGTLLQVSRIPVGKGYFIGSGVVNVIGTSFAFVNTALTFLNTEFARGTCQLAEDGSKLPCPEAYGAILGTASTVAIVAVVLSFTPPRYLRRIFTPLITGTVLLLIGLSLMSSGITNWAGGSGCQDGGLCPSADAPMAAPYGSPRLIGLGFLVWISIILIDLLGPPLLKNASVMLGLLVGIIVAAACGYFDTSVIDNAPAATFLWVRRFPLSVRGELVLPFLAAYLIVISEGIGNITATCEVSRLPVEGPRYASHIQGGLLSDALLSCLAGLGTVPPSTTFSQNCSVLQLSNNTSRVSGYVCGAILILAGVFSKFGAVFIAMPSSLIGGMTTFLFASVCVAGIKLLSGVHWSRRNRFIATASLSLGFAAICQPSWFSNFFTYSGSNHSLRGFLDALTLIVEESYLIALFIAVPLQAVMPLGEDDVVPPRDGDHDSVESVNQTKSARYQHSIERVGDVDEEMALGPIDSK